MDQVKTAGQVSEPLETLFNELMTAKETARVTTANNKFCFDLFRNIFAEKSKENVFISPFSIAAAVAMAQLGAKDATSQGIVKALSWQPDEEKETHEEFQTYLNVLKTSSDKYSLSTANRLYIQESFKILDEFVANATKYYLAEPVKADFANAAETERSNINTWVSKETQDKIKDLIPQGAVDSLTRMVIVNAIYFKGDWDVQFNEKRTTQQSFKVSPDQNKMVAMMNGKNKYRLGGSDSLKCRAIEIPYKGKDLSMVIVLPDEDFGLQALVETLNEENVRELFSGMSPSGADISLSLPKFEVTSTHSLKTALSALGMSDAFSSDTANFSGITGANDLYITAALHKAFIKVNEEGTEAAAATAMTFGLRSMPMSLPFVVDHPFLYIIRDNRTNGLILFVGAVVDPSL